MYIGTWAARKPDAPALIIAESGETTTYAELDRQSNKIAHFLRASGCEVGAHVAMLMGNTAVVYPIAWAAQRAGLYYTPINWHLTREEIEYIEADCDARLLFVDAEHAAVAAELARGSRATIVVHGEDVPGCKRLEDVIDSMPEHPVADEREGYDMIYTSGTTGRPKGGTRPLPGVHPAEDHPKLVAMPLLLGFDEDTVYLSPGAPLYHGAPLRFTLATQRLGGTVVLLSRFDALGSLEAIERYRVTHSQWVASMFVRLLRLSPEERSRFDLSSHRMAVHSAAPCPPSVKREMMEWWGPVVYEYYGATEGGLMTLINSEEWLAHPGSVGRPVIGRTHILDDQGSELPPGEVGHIYCERGGRVAYHNDPEKTAAAHSPQGWATVGDLGYLDDDGYLYLSSRRTDLIIAGGVNIYPKESEDVLHAHPAVADVAVIGVPQPEYGQEVKAVVELHDPDAASEDLAAELIEYCRQHLAAYKCPRSVDFDARLPRAPSGKLYKQRVLERYWADDEEE
jgi:long-chain acyl-CoA synthetase